MNGRPAQSLHTRTLRVVAAAVAAMLLVLVPPLWWSWTARIEAAEAREMGQQIGRAMHRIAADAEQLRVSVHDYSVWDEMFLMVTTGDLTYAERNYVDSTFEVNRLGAIVFLDLRGEVVFAKAWHLAGKRPRRLPDGLLEALRPRANGAEGGASLIGLPEGPWLVAWHPVLPSERDQAAAGLGVFARPLDRHAVDAISADLLLEMDLIPPVAGQPPLKITDRRPVWTQTVRSPNRVDGHLTLAGLDGAAAAALEVRMAREVYQEGQRALWATIAALVMSGLAFGALLSVLIQRLVLARLDRLVTDVRGVGSAGDATLRVRADGHDELGGLARAINAMLDTLDTLSRGLAQERARTQKLLHNVLPHVIADRLMDHRGRIADAIPDATVLFADLVGFTELTRSLPAEELVGLLDALFSRVDRLAERHGVEKVKTIGDAWMGVAGAPDPRADHVEAAARFALAVPSLVRDFAAERGVALNVRVGLHSGPLIAGVIGQSRLGWDVWGDTVNTAARLESAGEPGRVHLSQATAARLGPGWAVQPRGAVPLKGLGALSTAWLEAGPPEPALDAAPTA